MEMFLTEMSPCTFNVVSVGSQTKRLFANFTEKSIPKNVSAACDFVKKLEVLFFFFSRLLCTESYYYVCMCVFFFVLYFCRRAEQSEAAEDISLETVLNEILSAPASAQRSRNVLILTCGAINDAVYAADVAAHFAASARTHVFAFVERVNRQMVPTPYYYYYFLRSSSVTENSIVIECE